MTNGNVKAVCKWIGNTPAVAMQHYAQVTESDMQEAAKMTVLDDAEKRVQEEVQNQVQSTADSSGFVRKEPLEASAVTPDNCESKQEFATACESVQNVGKWAIRDSNARPAD